VGVGPTLDVIQRLTNQNFFGKSYVPLSFVAALIAHTTGTVNEVPSACLKR